MKPSFRQLVVAAVALVPFVLVPRVHAFGGLWSKQDAPVAQTATQVIFVDNPDSTMTAIVRVHYSGPADAFAWLIPIPGTPTVRVSSSTVFERLNAATTPEYWLEYNLGDSCKPADPDAGIATLPGGELPPIEPVEVLDRGAVGPYDYVTIAVDPSAADPARAATDWLASNGFAVAGASEALAPYLREGLHVLAFKLAKGSDAGAIKPVILTYESDRPMIPIRPSRGAAQDGMELQVWVVGPSQAVPANYRSLVLNDALIDWLSAERFRGGTLPSGGAGPFGPAIDAPDNYAALVSAATREAGGRAFVTELAGPTSQYRDKLWSEADEQLFTTVFQQKYSDGLDAILIAVSSYAGWDGLRDAIEGATTLPSGVTLEVFSRDPEAHRGAAKVDTAKFLQLLEERVIRPVFETAALLQQAPYLTRLYSVMNPGEMTEDPAFDYNFDLAQVSSVHIARQFLECSVPLEFTTASWRIELPQGGVVVGSGESGWPVAAGSLPANLKIVSLAERGSGTVIADNSRDIGDKLFAAAGTHGSMTTLPPPSIGLRIGGTQSVGPRIEPTTPQPEAKSDEGCHVATPSGGLSIGLPLALWLIAGTRRRARGGDSRYKGRPS